MRRARSPRRRSSPSRRRPSPLRPRDRRNKSPPYLLPRHSPSPQPRRLSPVQMRRSPLGRRKETPRPLGRTKDRRSRSPRGRSISVGLKMKEKSPPPKYRDTKERSPMRKERGDKLTGLMDKPVFPAVVSAMYDPAELKKIRVDIRRNVPIKSRAPVVRKIINPEQLLIYRRPGEGTRPIFDREDIFNGGEIEEQRVVMLDNPSNRYQEGYGIGMGRSFGRERSLTPHFAMGDRGFNPSVGGDLSWKTADPSEPSFTTSKSGRRQERDGSDGPDLRQRLNERQVQGRDGPEWGDDRRYNNRDDRHDSREWGNKDKLRDQDDGGPKAWDVNPEYVPKGKSYFEHDNRDTFTPRSRGGWSRGGSNRGSGGRGRGGRGGFERRQDRGDYPRHPYGGRRGAPDFLKK